MCGVPAAHHTNARLRWPLSAPLSSPAPAQRREKGREGTTQLETTL